MYRIFCESYQNFLNSFVEDNYRLQIAKPIELIVDVDKYEEEKKNNTILYQKLCDLLCYMKEHIEQYPKIKAFLWTLEARNIIEMKCNCTEEEELEEQTKLVNSFLKLAYWY